MTACWVDPKIVAALNSASELVEEPLKETEFFPNRNDTVTGVKLKLVLPRHGIVRVKLMNTNV